MIDNLQRARNYFAARDFESALRIAQAELQRNSSHPPALSIAANAAIQLGRDKLALDLLQRLHRMDPTNVPVLRNLSRVLNRLGLAASKESNAIEAETYWQSALQLWPEHHEARFNLAQSFKRRNEHQLAFTAFSELHAHNPQDEEIALALAEICFALENNEQALSLAQRKYHDPALASRWCEIAVQLQRTDLWHQALPMSMSVESLTLATVDAVSVLTDMGVADEVRESVLIAATTRALPAQTSPSLLMTLARYLSLPSVLSSKDQLLTARAQFEQGLSRLENEFTKLRLSHFEPRLSQLTWSNFLLAYQGLNDRELQSRYGDWLCAAAKQFRPDLAEPPARRKPGKPRIGLISGNWYESTAGYYFESWVDGLNTHELEIHVIAIGPRFDEFTDRMQARISHFHRLEGNPDSAADAIRALDLDLAIYPEIGMDTRLLPLAALRLARRQWMAWGHPVTSGLPSIDMYLSCAAMEPGDGANHYREKLVLLPALGTRYRLPDFATRKTRDELGLPSGKLLVIPQSSFKIHPDNDILLAEIMRHTPDAQLLLFAPESKAQLQRLRTRITAGNGAHSADRITFLPMTSRQGFLQILAACDLMLDTLHWSGGNSSLDALRVGLPIITCRGQFMRGRQTAAMLEALGHSQCVATNTDELIALACNFLSHSNSLPKIELQQLDEFTSSVAPLRALRQLVEQTLSDLV